MDTDKVSVLTVDGSKVDIVKALKLHSFVDDKGKTVEELFSGAPDCKSFVMDRPWNRGAEYAWLDRVHNIAEYWRRVKEHYGIK